MNKFQLFVVIFAAVATSVSANVCEGIADGQFVEDPFGDCASYIVCFGNIEHPRRCPDGFYFDLAGQFCNYWDAVPCGDPEGPCYGQPQYVYVARPTGTCSSYYRCEYQEGVPLDCPDGLYFNEAAQTCDYPENVACVDPTAPTPSTQPTTTVVQTTTTTTGTTTIPTASTPAPTTRV